MTRVDRPRVLRGAGGYTFEGNSPGVLLLHGFPGAPADLRPIADYLWRQGHAVSAPRIAGHGTSPEDLARRSADDWLESARAALSALLEQTERVVVVGQSLGGVYALELAATEPRVAGLVVLGTPIRDIPEGEELVRSSEPGAMLPHPWAAPGVLTHDLGAGGLYYLELPVGALGEALALIRRVRERVATLRTPALLFYAEADSIVGIAHGRYLAEHLASDVKELVLLTGSAHLIALDYERERVAIRIGDFVAEHAGRAA